MMKLLNLLLVFGQIFATGIPSKYLPQNDPTISHLLLKDSTQVDRLAVYATVMHEFKRDRKKISKAFKAEFERIKAERAAQLAAGKSPLSGVSGKDKGNTKRNNATKARKGAARPVTTKNPSSAKPRVKKGRSAPRTSANSAQTGQQSLTFSQPQPFQQSNQPFQPMSQPAPFGQQRNKPRPFQPMSQPSFQLGNYGGSSGSTGSMDSEAQFILANFTEKFRDTIYRFEERRRMMGGSPPRPAPFPAQPPPVVAQPPKPVTNRVLGLKRKLQARKAQRTTPPPPTSRPPPKARTPVRRTVNATPVAAPVVAPVAAPVAAARTPVQPAPKARPSSTAAKMLHAMRMRRGAPSKPTTTPTTSSRTSVTRTARPSARPSTPPPTTTTPPAQVQPVQEVEEAAEEQE